MERPQSTALYLRPSAAQPSRAGDLSSRRLALGRKWKGTLAHVELATTLPSPELPVLGSPGPAKYQRAMAPAPVCLMNRRMRGPHVRWCGRGGRSRNLPDRSSVSASDDGGHTSTLIAFGARAVSVFSAQPRSYRVGTASMTATATRLRPDCRPGRARLRGGCPHARAASVGPRSRPRWR